MSLAWEPLFRLAQCLVALWLLRILPQHLRSAFLPAGYVRVNFKT